MELGKSNRDDEEDLTATMSLSRRALREHSPDLGDTLPPRSGNVGRHRLDTPNALTDSTAALPVLEVGSGGGTSRFGNYVRRAAIVGGALLVIEGVAVIADALLHKS